MFCPVCGSEYREGFTRCDECDVTLVEERPEPLQGHEAEETVKVFETTDLSLITVVKSILTGAEIPFTLRGEGLMNLFPSEALSPMIDPRRGDGVQILVPGSRAKEAAELLESQGESSLEEVSEDSEDEQGS